MRGRPLVSWVGRVDVVSDNHLNKPECRINSFINMGIVQARQFVYVLQRIARVYERRRNRIEWMLSHRPILQYASLQTSQTNSAIPQFVVSYYRPSICARKSCARSMPFRYVSFTACSG